MAKHNDFLGINSAFLEQLYQQFLKNPNMVDESWHHLFKDLQFSTNHTYNHHHALHHKSTQMAERLTAAYQTFGHIAHHMRITEQQHLPPCLELEHYGLMPDDLLYHDGNYLLAKDLLNNLRSCYAERIGVELSHLPPEQKEWLTKEMLNLNYQLPAADRVQALHTMLKVESLENFLQKKLPGANIFAIAGGEGVMAGVNYLFKLLALADIEEVCLGMSHRGRISTMVCLMNRDFASIFGDHLNPNPHYPIDFSGDVRYHLGYSNTLIIDGKKLTLELLPNPSHLELVNAVALGYTKAKRDAKTKAACILLHGDAAFCGQGVASEAIQLTRLPAYQVGGTIHIIINNQIGFTTNPQEFTGGIYCTDIAKASCAPILHVDGMDPEAIMVALQLAVSYRQHFQCDAVVDILCHRKYGHNEGDEPNYTQPIMYRKIANQPRCTQLYAQSLITDGIIDDGNYSQMQINNWNETWKISANSKTPFISQSHASRKPITITEHTLSTLANTLWEIPNDFNLHPKIASQLQSKLHQLETAVDWATAESLAFSVLLKEGYNIRLCGQDCQRGTFAQRHAVWIDQQNNQPYYPYSRLGKFEIYNSNLSEVSALAFEYGYSLNANTTINIWEAQYGDFANSAQAVIDQYISSGEAKWCKQSRLILMLPHGYEGQGPEHSSARLERFLQLCACNNLRVLNCSTPASFFHSLLKQAHDVEAKPTVMLTPKSLLRHNKVRSRLSELTSAHQFRPAITDAIKPNANSIIMCSGKVYYELKTYQETNQIEDVILVRLEQLYPFPNQQLLELLNDNCTAKLIWCQEEPENMGAFAFVKLRLQKLLSEAGKPDRILHYSGRPEAASPATGYYSVHQREQTALVANAYNKSAI